MSKHTPEPWTHAPEGMIVSMSPDTQPEDAVVANIKPKDARRIVTCVNACAGMADPAAEIAELKRQRYELLAVLEDLLHNSRSPHSGDPEIDADFERRYRTISESAIATAAKIKGSLS